MFDALARLADGHARRVGLFAIAFFLLAGALGGSVADRLDPYGADDPATETVEAREQLHDAGLRIPAVLVVVEDAPVAAPATRAPGRGARTRAARARRRQVGHQLLRHPLPRLRLQRRPLHLLRRRSEADRRQGVAGSRRRDRRPARRPARASSSAAPRSPRSRSTSRSRRTCEWPRCSPSRCSSCSRFLFFRSLVASLLPLMIGGLAIVGTFLILRIASEFGSISIFALNLTTGARAGPGDRLQPLHRLPLPRGDRQGRAGAGGDAPRARDRRPHGLLLLADRRRGARLAARLPAALPLLDGARRRAGRPASRR